MEPRRQPTFEDYHMGFNANQRRNIKRERKAVAKAGSAEAATIDYAVADHDLLRAALCSLGTWQQVPGRGLFCSTAAPRSACSFLPRSAIRWRCRCACRTADIWGPYWGSHAERLRSISDRMGPPNGIVSFGRSRWGTNAAEVLFPTPAGAGGGQMELIRQHHEWLDQGDQWQPLAPGHLAG